MFVANLNPMSTDDDLYHYFIKFGEVESAFVVKDFKTQKSLSYGYVIFRNLKSMEKTLRHQKHVLQDRELVLEKFLGKNAKERRVSHSTSENEEQSGQNKLIQETLLYPETKSLMDDRISYHHQGKKSKNRKLKYSQKNKPKVKSTQNGYNSKNHPHWLHSLFPGNQEAHFGNYSIDILKQRNTKGHLCNYASTSARKRRKGSSTTIPIQYSERNRKRVLKKFNSEQFHEADTTDMGFNDFHEDSHSVMSSLGHLNSYDNLLNISSSAVQQGLVNNNLFLTPDQTQYKRQNSAIVKNLLVDFDSFSDHLPEFNSVLKFKQGRGIQRKSSQTQSNTEPFDNQLLSPFLKSPSYGNLRHSNSQESWVNSFPSNHEQGNPGAHLFTPGSLSTGVSQSPQTSRYAEILNKYSGRAQRLNLKYISNEAIEEENEKSPPQKIKKINRNYQNPFQYQQFCLAKESFREVNHSSQYQNNNYYQNDLIQINQKKLARIYWRKKTNKKFEGFTQEQSMLKLLSKCAIIRRIHRIKNYLRINLPSYEIIKTEGKLNSI